MKCLIVFLGLLATRCLADDPVAAWSKDVPLLSGSHPSVRPDGKSLSVGGKPDEWGIVVGDMNGGKWVLLHSFDQTKGAKSWRRNDPHPAFSADGKRIYYNASDGEFTRLMVAERTLP